MSEHLIEPPGALSGTFLDFPLVTNLDNFDAHIAILGIPFGMPYQPATMANDQSRAPDAIRRASNTAHTAYTRNHYDWDLGGPLLDDQDVRVVGGGYYFDGRLYARYFHAAAGWHAFGHLSGA